ncbi:MAG: rRNA maturation RNase YbeY [Candidatus Omnitrophica bacterium]|nr:rRNA maturation RNase YbeY [Candidatus Omnitrophota bacterium]
MKVDIRDLQSRVKFDSKKIVQRAQFVLNKMGEDKGELSLLFVADSYIRQLNSKYRKVDSKTDVLAFSMREGYGLPKVSPILGDVVISTETAKREAKKRGVSIQSEIELYLVHGILHLLGYKDERTRDRKKMRAKEKELLRVM